MEFLVRRPWKNKTTHQGVATHSLRTTCVVVRAFASQSADLGFIPYFKSYQKTLKNGIHGFSAWHSVQKEIEGRSSRQVCLLCPWARHLTGSLYLYVADRWRTRTSPGYNCEAAHPACYKRRLLGTHQWQSALLVVGLPFIHDWFEKGCYLFPSLIQFS